MGNAWNYYVGKWFKDHPRSNITHKIVRYNEKTGILATRCGRTITTQDATAATGVLRCIDCLCENKRIDTRGNRR